MYGSEEGPDLNADHLGSDRGVSLWLFGCSAVVFGMVVLGGLTRLTKSGLSMVEWRPASFLPPLNDAEWRKEFEKYQQFPEYKRSVTSQWMRMSFAFVCLSPSLIHSLVCCAVLDNCSVNNQMSLDDFKFIYRMEFSHRLLGRSLGIVFAVPFAYFAVKGRVNRSLLARLALAFTAGGAQGAVGWWMVRSGLETDTLHSSAHNGSVHVSPYRLAAHLLSAFAIYSLLLSTAMRVHPSTFSAPLHASGADGISSPAARAVAEFFSSPALRRVRILSALTLGAVGLTVASGAFVAGNEAGLVYNEFPLMGGSLWPSDMVNPYLKPAWRNGFENSTAVQWHHRVLAITTATLALTTAAVTLRAGKSAQVTALIRQSTQVAERYARLHRGAIAITAAVTLQVSLGIITLLLHVPVPLATAHQTGSMLLLTAALYLLACTRNPTTVAHVKRLVAIAAKQHQQEAAKVAVRAAGKQA